MNPRPARCSRLSLALSAAALLLAGPTAWAEGDKHAWTQAGVSSGLHSLDHAVTITYQPATAIPPGSVITRVHANRAYAGQADVQTSLCWNGLERCVDMIGRSINTRSFNGLDAGQPLYLVHRARNWRGSRGPLYVKGNVTVWYAPASQ